MKWIDAPISIKVSRDIKNVRKWRGMTQEELALKTGIDLKILKRIEREKFPDITILQAYKIRWACNCSIGELIPLVDNAHLAKKYLR